MPLLPPLPPTGPASDPASDPASNSDTEIPRSERIDLALKAWRDTAGTLSISEAARDYGIPKSTLVDRIHGATSVKISD